jgi:hypothetical protein
MRVHALMAGHERLERRVARVRDRRRRQGRNHHGTARSKSAVSNRTTK